MSDQFSDYLLDQFKQRGWLKKAGNNLIIKAREKRLRNEIDESFEEKVPACPVPEPTPTPVPTPTPTPVDPVVEKWRRNMVDFGGTYARYMLDSATSDNDRLAACYYDAPRVFLQIYYETRNYLFFRAATEAMRVYVNYLKAATTSEGWGGVPGYWNFPHGLKMLALDHGDPASREACINLSRNAAFSRDLTNDVADNTASFKCSREVAYAINAHLCAMELGEPERPRLRKLIDFALGHVDQWFVSKTAEWCQPFMVALTCEALIAAYEWGQYRRQDIFDAIENCADGLILGNYVIDGQIKLHFDPYTYKFWYSTVHRHPGQGDEEQHYPTADLNLLIAPLFVSEAFINTDYHAFANEVFEAGVNGAWLGNAKQFNQNYRWSFDYVKGRAGIE